MIALINQGFCHVLGRDPVLLFQMRTAEYELMHAPFPIGNRKSRLKPGRHIIGIEHCMPGSRPDAFAAHPEDIHIRSQQYQEVPPEQADLADRILFIPTIDIPAVGQFDIWFRQKRAQSITTHHRSAARPATSMRSGKGLVQIEMNYIKTHLSRGGHTHDCIQVRPIIVQQGSACVDHFRYLQDVLLKQPQGIGIGQHQGCRAFIELGSQILKIDHALAITCNRHHIKAVDSRTCRIGTMGTDGNKHLGALALPFLD